MTDIPRSSPSPEEQDDASKELDKILDEVDEAIGGNPATTKYLGAEALQKLVPKPRDAA